MNSYFEFSYNDVLTFLENLPEDKLKPMFYEYDTSDLGELAAIISDEDVINLGYENNTKLSEDFDYRYSDIDNITKILTDNLDSYDLEILMRRYNCNDLQDLAIALTDDEIDQICGNKETDNLNVIDTTDYDYSTDYDEDLDYLEDIYETPYKILDKDSGLISVPNSDYYYAFCEELDKSLIDECSKPEELDGDIYFNITPHKFEVNEDVIINDTLNTELFDENNKLLPEIKDQLLQYVDGFVNKMTEKSIDIPYSDVNLVGSNAGYIYTPDSDIDIHIIAADALNTEDAEHLFDEFDLYEAENPLFIGESKVELGIEDNYNIIMNNKDARRYSLVTDEWVDDSDKFEQFKPEDISQVEGYEDTVQDYTNKINDVIDSENIDQALALKREIRKARSEDLANAGSLSMGNVVFKELRNNGSYGKLKGFISDKMKELEK